MPQSAEVLEQSSIVQVFRLAYPKWVKKVKHPDLEVGPLRFDVAKLEQWLVPGQQEGWVLGHAIYEALKAEDGIPSCLGLIDLFSVQCYGFDFFCKYFKGKTVCGWRSVVDDRRGRRYVPFLVESHHQVVQGWRSLGENFDFSFPAFRFSK